MQSVIIQSFGKLGAYFYKNEDVDMDNILVALQNVNWSRSAECWYLRVVKENGRMINNEKAISLAVNMLKKLLGIKLSEYENDIEKDFIKNKNRGKI